MLARALTMNSKSTLVFVLSQILIRISITSAGSHCSATGNFTSNGSYAKNLNRTLSLLPANISTANGLFFAASIGKDSDQVHVLSLCRADSTPEGCAACVTSTVQELTQACPYRKEALGMIGCTVRYSNHSILGKLELSPTKSGYNVADVTTDMKEFDRTWESLMERVLTKASTGSSTLKFATGNVELNVFQKIHTFMQCTPDLTQSDCSICLREVVSSYISCCHGKQGGYVHKPSCTFRWDLYPFYNSSLDDPSPPPPPLPSPTFPPNVTNPKLGERGKFSISSPTLIAMIITPICFIVILVLCFFLFLRSKSKENAQAEDDEISTVEYLQFDFGTIRAATNDFSDDNKLGQGGFGVVYKGKLCNGQDIAVKRLSKNSRQGELEFKNEVLLVARLEHRNLVRLLGFSLEKEERLLIYELFKNSSLDNYIYDPAKRARLDWEKRYKIIGGIARGLLYLHEDSRLRIIHRDLKASNILLDAEMNPKISDFGMARLFAVDQSQANTRRVVGTYGYMPPEYAMHGRFSVKSDVFSFGVLALEIICGKKNSDFQSEESGEGLVTYVWKNWNKGRTKNLIDPTLRSVGSRSEMMRCIHIGLLCVQENVEDRPTMASVLLMLSSNSITLKVPSKPAFFMHSTMQHDSRSSPLDESGSDSIPISVNEASITELYPR